MATVRLDQKRHALVRAVPDSYPKALARFFGSGPTDIATARAQHQAYRQALRQVQRQESRSRAASGLGRVMYCYETQHLQPPQSAYTYATRASEVNIRASCPTKGAKA